MRAVLRRPREPRVTAGEWIAHCDLITNSTAGAVGLSPHSDPCMKVVFPELSTATALSRL